MTAMQNAYWIDCSGFHVAKHRSIIIASCVCLAFTSQRLIRPFSNNGPSSSSSSTLDGSPDPTHQEDANAYNRRLGTIPTHNRVAVGCGLISRLKVSCLIAWHV
jgi:hypothetical protein